FLVAIPQMVQRYKIETGHDYGIIIDYSVKSLAAPQRGSTELFIVHEGSKVKILEQDGNWYKIELIDGKQGWITAGGVGII
ncbi:MAG: SH3 domain-containing protein, partial [Candidatus Marinimicrobia bacterium]|nr:SH3 domain-containing protein [Candidatus Neomarinimicrobiota bacterium]